MSLTSPPFVPVGLCAVVPRANPNPDVASEESNPPENATYPESESNESTRKLLMLIRGYCLFITICQLDIFDFPI